MFKKVEFLLITGLMSLLVSCENFLNGSKLRNQLEEEIAYANAQSFSVRIATDKGTGTIVTGAGDKSVKVNDQLTLEFEVDEGYIFLYWTAIDKDTGAELSDCVEFFPKNKEATVAKILKQENITIKPVCVEKGKINISFAATHGSIVPAEDKSYYSGNTFNLRYSEDGDYAFTGWKVIDVATNQEVDDALKFDNNGKDVVVEVLKTGISVKIIAENGERPVVMDFVPGFKNEGVYIDSMLKFIFNKAMDASSIYWTKEELSEMGITEGGYDLYPAEVDGNIIKNSDEEVLYYAYRAAGDESGSSLVYKNYAMNIRGTTENLLSHYGCPYFDVTKAILNVPVNQGNLPPKITEIEFKISKDMVSSEGISLKSSFQKFYFTGATTDNDPPDFVNLEVEQLLENGSWTKIEKKDNVDHTKPNNFKLLNIGAKNLKVKVKGVVTDTGSKPAKLKVFLNPLYTDYYDGQQKIEVGEKSLPSAGAIAEFPEGIEFDFSGKVIPQGIYLLSVAAVDNAGKEKVESFKMVYDYTPPEASELTYVSTYAQDRLTVGRRNDTRDIYKTEITGFKDNSIKTVTRDENVELIGLAGTAPSRTHTITLKEYDYLGNYATYTKVVQAIPEPGMYYFSDDYWTKDSSRRYTTVIGAGGYEFNRETILWGIITSQGFGKNGGEYTNVRVLAYNAGVMYFYGPRSIAPWDSDEMKGSDGLKDLKYVIDNCDYQKLRNETKTINTSTYRTIWSECDYEKKIYVPGNSELAGIFAEDKRRFNEAVAAYDGGVTAYRIRDDEFYFSSTPYYNSTAGGIDGREWFWCIYSGPGNKAGMMKKDKSSGNVHSDLSKRGVQTLTGACLKLVRQVDFD